MVPTIGAPPSGLFSLKQHCSSTCASRAEALRSCRGTITIKVVILGLVHHSMKNSELCSRNECNNELRLKSAIDRIIHTRQKNHHKHYYRSDQLLWRTVPLIDLTHVSHHVERLPHTAAAHLLVAWSSQSSHCDGARRHLLSPIGPPHSYSLGSSEVSKCCSSLRLLMRTRHCRT
jgi:hypothetical protein